MSAPLDHDRELARALDAWLGEGPARAPEPPLRAALNHARAHPRGRDPLAAFRSDPMPGARRRASLFGLQPATAVAVLALTVAMVAGAVWVGANLDGPAPVPLPSPTAAPTSPASPPPTAAPTPFEIVVGLQTGTAADMTVRVVDRTGRLVSARSGPPADGGSVPGGMLRVDNLDERTVRVRWTDAVCSIDYRLDIEPGPVVEVRLTAPPCEGDTMALDRVLLLEFDAPIDAAGLRTRIVEASPGPG